MILCAWLVEKERFKFTWAEEFVDTFDLFFLFWLQSQFNIWQIIDFFYFFYSLGFFFIHSFFFFPIIDL